MKYAALGMGILLFGFGLFGRREFRAMRGAVFARAKILRKHRGASGGEWILDVDATGLPAALGLGQAAEVSVSEDTWKTFEVGEEFAVYASPMKPGVVQHGTKFSVGLASVLFWVSLIGGAAVMGLAIRAL